MKIVFVETIGKQLHYYFSTELYPRVNMFKIKMKNEGEIEKNITFMSLNSNAGTILRTCQSFVKLKRL